jgi:hypothetical protein
MVDTTTPLLGLLLQGTGGNNNSWGENLNNDVFTPLETAIADALPIATTGGTLTLTATQARYAAILLTGNLASDLVIVVPNTNKLYRIINNTVGGGFFTRLKCVTAATAVNIPAGGKLTSVTAISGAPYRHDAREVGRYAMDAATLTGDVLEANGAAYKRTSLPELFAKIGTAYGFNDITDFKVPNAFDTGRFLRSRSASVAVGASQANQNKAHTHTGSGTTTAMSANATHSHTASGTTDGQNVDHTHTGSGSTSTVSTDHTHTYSGSTGNQNANHTHNEINSVYSGANVSGAGNIPLYTVSSGVTGPENQVHQHAYSGTTSAASTAPTHAHTYSFTTSGTSTSHTHTYSHTTNTVNVDHTHSYSFTTSGGSADGTEARPESLVGILCIRY